MSTPEQRQKRKSFAWLGSPDREDTIITRHETALWLKAIYGPRCAPADRCEDMDLELCECCRRWKALDDLFAGDK